jgi:hypothetical protein
MFKNKQIEVIRKAFGEIPELYDGWYEVRMRLYDMNVSAEKQHRRGRFADPSPLSVKDGAKYFVVKHLLDGVRESDRFTVDDILAIRNEVLYAQAYAKKFHDKLTAWAEKWAKDFEQVDYSELMKGAA